MYQYYVQDAISGASVKNTINYPSSSISASGQDWPAAVTEYLPAIVLPVAATATNGSIHMSTVSYSSRTAVPVTANKLFSYGSMIDVQRLDNKRYTYRYSFSAQFICTDNAWIPRVDLAAVVDNETWADVAVPQIKKSYPLFGLRLDQYKTVASDTYHIFSGQGFLRDSLGVDAYPYFTSPPSSTTLFGLAVVVSMYNGSSSEANINKSTVSIMLERVKAPDHGAYYTAI